MRHKFSPGNFEEIAEIYSEAFALYQERKLEDAEQVFRALAGFDKPSRALAARCGELCARPPAEWRGIFAIETK
jgi:hypothetical protein